MTTKAQNFWAQHLEDATQKEIREMAQYAMDHIEDEKEIRLFKKYVDELTGKFYEDSDGRMA